MYLQFKAGYNTYVVEVSEENVGIVSSALLKIREVTNPHEFGEPVKVKVAPDIELTVVGRIGEYEQADES